MIKQTDAIFAKLKVVNTAADETKTVLRVSWDAKTAVKIGDFVRGGQNRLARKGADHDFKPEAILNPFGILLPQWDDLNLYFTTSPVTSDFIVDMLERQDAEITLAFARCVGPPAQRWSQQTF